MSLMILTPFQMILGHQYFMFCQRYTRLQTVVYHLIILNVQLCLHVIPHTENISKYLDHIVKPHTVNVSSYIKDTTDFINKIKDFKFNSKKSYLVTLDESFFTQIYRIATVLTRVNTSSINDAMVC